MDTIMKFVKKNEEQVSVNDVHAEKTIPPFYKEAFDEFPDYEFIGTSPVSPLSLFRVGDVQEGLAMKQVRERDQASEELTARINRDGYDGARLILVEDVDGDMAILSGHARWEYCKNNYKSILVYVVKSTKSKYDVNDTLDLQAALNAENDVSDKVTIDDLIKIASTKIQFNMGELVPGMTNNKETIRYWLKRIGADKQYKGIDGGTGGLAKVYKSVMRMFGNRTPEEVGILPMKGKEQHDKTISLQSKAPEGVAWLSLDVSSGTTTNSQALIGRVARSVSSDVKKINIVVGSNEQDNLSDVHWNRFLLVNDFFDKLNSTLVGLAKLAGLNTVARSQEDWEKVIQVWTFVNTVKESQSPGLSNPYTYKWNLIPTSLSILEAKASQGINAKKYTKLMAA